MTKIEFEREFNSLGFTWDNIIRYELFCAVKSIQDMDDTSLGCSTQNGDLMPITIDMVWDYVSQMDSTEVQNYLDRLLTYVKRHSM